MALDFSLAKPSVVGNPMAAYAQGQEMQQRSFEMAAARQKAVDTQKIMQDYASDQRETASGVITPLESAEKDTKTAQKLFAVGNFKEGTALLDMAKENRQLAKDTLSEGQKTQQGKLEASAKASLVALDNSADPVVLMEAGNRYLAAGGDPQRLAALKTPEDTRRFLKEQAKAAMTSSDQLKWEADAEAKRIAALELERHHRELEKERALRARELAARANGTAEKPMTQNQEATHTETLNRELERNSKPYMEDLHHIQLFKQLLKTGTPVAMQQLHQDLPAALGKFSARATNLYYKDNKNFGDIVNRLSDATSHMVAGQYSEETKKSLYEMFDSVEQDLITPALSSMENDQRKKAKRMNLNAENILLLDKPEVMKTPKTKSEEIEVSKTIGTVTYVKRGGKWYQQ